MSKKLRRRDTGYPAPAVEAPVADVWEHEAAFQARTRFYILGSISADELTA